MPFTDRTKEIDKIMEKLFKVQGKLLECKFVKDQVNAYLTDVQNKGKRKVSYVHLNTITNAVVKYCREENILAMQPTAATGGHEYSLSTYLRFFDLDSKQLVEDMMTLSPKERSTHGQAGCTTYARRYLQFGFFMLPAHDDDGATAMGYDSGGKPAEPQKIKPKEKKGYLTGDQQTELSDLCRAKGMSQAAVKKIWKEAGNATSFSDVKSHYYEAIKEELK
jgi:hypothetical protein